MAKPPNDYTGFYFRISDDLLEWLRDYSKRINKSMGTIIKEYLEAIRQQDEQNVEEIMTASEK